MRPAPLDLAELFVERLRDATGQTLDYSLDSLALLDDLLEEWLHFAEVYGSDRPHDLSHLEQPLVAYVGETLRRTFGGYWIERPGRSVVQLAQHIELDLFPLVRSILAHQRPPAFARLAAAVERELEESSEQ